MTLNQQTGFRIDPKLMHPIESPKRVPLNRCEKFDSDQDGSGQKSEVSVWIRKSILCAELGEEESAVVEPNSVKKHSCE